MVFASTVRFTANTALTNPLGFVGWVVKWIYCFTDLGFAFLGCCLFVVLVVLARGLHPVSFPNLEVKPFCADGTAAGRSWESRALPTVSLKCGGGVDPVCGVGAPTTLLFYQPGPGVVVGKEKTTWAFLPIPHPTYLIRLWHGPKCRHQPRAI